MTINKAGRLKQLENQKTRIESQLHWLEKTEKRFPWYRFISFFAGIMITITFAQFFRPWLVWCVGLFSLSIFAYFVYSHRKVEAAIFKFSTLNKINQQQIARTQFDWQILPEPPIDGFQNHPFEKDLNLFGKKSLHHLLNTASSKGGSLRLLEWLINTNPDIATIQNRQISIQELTQHYGFRSKMAFLGAMTSDSQGGSWNGDQILKWIDQKSDLKSLKKYLSLLLFFALINFSLFSLYAFGLIPGLWIFSVIIYLAIQSFRYRQTQDLFNEAYQLATMLSGFMPILREIEHYPAHSGEVLSELFKPIQEQKFCPSKSLRKLSRIVSAASLQNNPFAALFLNLLIPWNVIFLYKLNQYKRELRVSLPIWLDVWHELEALISLSNYAFLNPKNTFPNFMCAKNNSDKIFSAKELSHPLIPDNLSVPNDFSVSDLGALAIITGSNMSGKSTFLRTIGINLQLAFAGSTVSAIEFATIPFRLFTCINLSDSLLDGISYFYAEVKRLKNLLNELKINDDLPLFYLIDEIFRGTNNRERQIGSRAFTRTLLGKNGTGLISTHDLELVNLEKESDKIINYHFKETVADGKMVFDYRLRTGPCPTTNALKIMAFEGLLAEDDRNTQ